MVPVNSTAGDRQMSAFRFVSYVSFILSIGLVRAAISQEAPPASPPQATAGDASDSDQAARLCEFLSGCKFIGKFTVDGEESSKTEEYTIKKCEKLAEGDLYRLTARIKYGSTDTELPMDLPIRWSGNTPVITLDGVWIPGLGTFSARVLLHQERYAGTWQHGEKGGHMFGRLEKVEK